MDLDQIDDKLYTQNYSMCYVIHEKLLIPILFIFVFLLPPPPRTNMVC